MFLVESNVCVLNVDVMTQSGMTVNVNGRTVAKAGMTFGPVVTVVSMWQCQMRS